MPELSSEFHSRAWAASKLQTFSAAIHEYLRASPERFRDPHHSRETPRLARALEAAPRNSLLAPADSIRRARRQDETRRRLFLCKGRSFPNRRVVRRRFRSRRAKYLDT